MAKRTRCLLVVVALSVAGVMLGCSASVGTTSGGNPFVAFTIGGRTITFTFGPAGVIQARANQTVSQAGQIILFDQAPTDTPATGQMTLLSSSVSATSLPTGKATVQQQADQLNGSAVVTFSVAPGGSTDPCSEGTFLAQYDLAVVNGQVNIADEVADLSWDALQTVFENSVTMCIEVWADFDGQLTMTNFALTFSEEERHDGGTGGGLIQVPIDSNGDAVEATTTAQGVGFAPVSVISVASPGSPQPVGPGSVNVDPAELGLEYVQTVYLATQTVYAFDLPPVPVATFICEYADGGPATALEMILGSNTAEHAWEDPDAAGYFGSPPPHNMPPVAYTMTTTNQTGTSFPQHAYFAEVSLDGSRTLSRMSLELADVNTIIPLHSDLSDHPDWLAQINLAMTLEGPGAAPTPDTGDGDDVTAEKLPAQVILNVTVLDNAGNPVSGQAVDLVAEKWTADGPVPDRRFELACSTNASGQCSGQMGFNLGGPTGEFVRFTASVTADGMTYTESADFHIDPTLPPDQEQWLTESVTIQLGTGGVDDDTDDDGAGGYTAADLAGCWRVTVTEQKEDGTTESNDIILEIDASGNLAAVWFEFEAEEEGTPVTQMIEFVRFTSPNAGFFAAVISNTQQQVSIGADGLADISFSFDITTDEEEPPQHMSLNISDAVLSGDPPSSFTSDSVTSESSEGTLVPPVTGQRVDCPVEAEQDVITQEEFELDFDISLCGAGTTLMVPLTFLALCWMKRRR